MPKHPPLSLVCPPTTDRSPPRQLGSHGRQLWDTVQNEYGIDDVGGRELLQQACAAVDLIEALGAAIARDGAVVYGRSGPKVHPAVKEQISARALAVRTLQRLGITDEVVKPAAGRPALSHWLDGRLTWPAPNAFR